MADDAVLEDPVWHALTGPHRDRALRATADDGEVLAVHYPRPTSPFAGLADVRREECWIALAGLLEPGERIALTLPSAEPFVPPPGWVLEMQMSALQMLLTAVEGQPAPVGVVELGPQDAAEMLALAELTRPGPFGPDTVTFGGYLGVRDGGRLVAMAGRRLHPEGYVEVSGVCTHPDLRGRGLSRTLVAEVARRILAEGDRPFLHVRAENLGAVGLYESMGFATVRAPAVVSLTRATDDLDA